LEPARRLGRPRNAYIREDRIVQHLAALTVTDDRGNVCPELGRADGVIGPAPATSLIDQLRAEERTLIYDARTQILQTGDGSGPTVALPEHR
jgi:hypothetical protein